jgi:hypothetical protein
MACANVLDVTNMVFVRCDDYGEDYIGATLNGVKTDYRYEHSRGIWFEDDIDVCYYVSEEHSKLLDSRRDMLSIMFLAGN